MSFKFSCSCANGTGSFIGVAGLNLTIVSLSVNLYRHSDSAESFKLADSCKLEFDRYVQVPLYVKRGPPSLKRVQSSYLDVGNVEVNRLTTEVETLQGRLDVANKVGPS